MKNGLRILYIELGINVIRPFLISNYLEQIYSPVGN